jgi:major membrane immunogen (membrane-anchored lipoprotein)
MNQMKFNHSVRKATAIAIFCVLAQGCAPSKKTGTVTDSGTVKGIAISKDGSLGKLDVELTVKLDDGKEVKATHMVDQDKPASMKGKRVEEEPGEGNIWKVVRVLN